MLSSACANGGIITVPSAAMHKTLTQARISISPKIKTEQSGHMHPSDSNRRLQ